MADIFLRCYDRTLNYLGRGIRSEWQVVNYLKQLLYKKKGKWYKELPSEEEQNEIIIPIIDRLKELNYINDENYATAFVESRLRNKPKGAKALIIELQQKGIAKDLAEKVCNDLVGDDQMELLKAAYKKKYGEERITMEDPKKINFLMRRGFDWDLISQFMKDDTGE